MAGSAGAILQAIAHEPDVVPGQPRPRWQAHRPVRQSVGDGERAGCRSGPDRSAAGASDSRYGGHRCHRPEGVSSTASRSGANVSSTTATNCHHACCAHSRSCCHDEAGHAGQLFAIPGRHLPVAPQLARRGARPAPARSPPGCSSDGSCNRRPDASSAVPASSPGSSAAGSDPRAPSSSVVTIPPSPVVSILLPKKLNVATCRASRRPASDPRAVRLCRVLDDEESCRRATSMMAAMSRVAAKMDGDNCRASSA